VNLKGTLKSGIEWELGDKTSEDAETTVSFRKGETTVTYVYPQDIDQAFYDTSVFEMFKETSLAACVAAFEEMWSS